MKYVFATDREIMGYEWRSQDASPTTRSNDEMNAEAKVYEAITDAANKAAAEARTGNLGITKSDKAENPAEATDEYDRRQRNLQPMADRNAAMFADPYGTESHAAPDAFGKKAHTESDKVFAPLSAASLANTAPQFNNTPMKYDHTIADKSERLPMQDKYKAMYEDGR